jgi:hypothetical protein
LDHWSRAAAAAATGKNLNPNLWLIPTILQGQDWQEENSRLNWLTRPAHCNNTVIDIITLFPCLSVKQLVLPKISYLRKMSSQSKNRNCTCASICLALCDCVCIDYLLGIGDLGVLIWLIYEHWHILLLLLAKFRYVKQF